MLKFGIFVVVFAGFWIFKGFILCIPELIYWWTKDFKQFERDKFRLFGLYMFCGRQGSGKTTGMVYTLERYRRRYPKAKIYTNFGYLNETAPFRSLNDLLNENLLNGEDGVIFAIDEIQNEFSCKESKDFPESLLATVTQQRKQKMCILATSQVFTRVAKPLREQCFYVIDCFTFLGRYTRLKWFFADDYEHYLNNPSPKAKLKLRKKRKDCFVQSDSLRECFESYAKVRRLSRLGFREKLPDVALEPVIKVEVKTKK